MKRKNPPIGSSFEAFLDKEGILEGCTNSAIKRVIARQVEQALKQQRLTKAAMGRQMGTSRSPLDRLLDPENASVTLGTLQRPASVVGKRLRLDLVASK